MARPPLANEADVRQHLGALKLKRFLHDPTTGLPALALLFDRLRALLDQRRQIGAVHLEMADIELVESIYGWQVLDVILAQISSVLRQSLGQELPRESLLALNQVAGDRFVVFIADGPRGAEVESAFLAATGRALCSKLEAAFDGEAFRGLTPRPRFLAGHALLSHNPFYRFERCVAGAVEQARRCSERRERRRERSWAEELRGIMREGSIEMLFQPVVELGSNHQLGHEALVRGPQGTLFETPRAMFALSRRFGLDAELDRLCCEAALGASSRQAPAAGLAFINVLPANLCAGPWRDGALPTLLQSLGLAPAGVVFEISEREAALDPELFLRAVACCREEGFGLALDDMGTGGLGQETIERARPDYLKLDASLVRHIHENQIKLEVLLSLLALSRRMGTELIAEGVESPGEEAALTQAGARYAQGYRFAPPAAAGSGERARQA